MVIRIEVHGMRGEFISSTGEKADEELARIVLTPRQALDIVALLGSKVEELIRLLEETNVQSEAVAR